jgi:hypothetical protein
MPEPERIFVGRESNQHKLVGFLPMSEGMEHDFVFYSTFRGQCVWELN